MSPSTDRKLLELAAKAAGFRIDKSKTNGGGSNNDGFNMLGNAVLDWHNGITWNPLTDDGDALRLAVKLRISLEMAPEHVYAVHADTSAAQYRDTGSGQPMDQVVREAIVACAAEIGRALQPNHESPANSKPGSSDSA